MTDLRRLTFAATAAIVISLSGGCSQEASDPVPGSEVTGKTGQNPSGVPGGNSTSENPGNGPDSASDRSPDAPDNSISDRPGGPDQSISSEPAGGGTGSGGLSPPRPTPVR
ncbi:MAG: hypothetical protein WD181_00215 [Solirubrobacterales bacterium]